MTSEEKMALRRVWRALKAAHPVLAGHGFTKPGNPCQRVADATLEIEELLGPDAVRCVHPGCLDRPQALSLCCAAHDALADDDAQESA